MEYLYPQRKGAAGWDSLYNPTHAGDEQFTTKEEQDGLTNALYKVLDALKMGNFVRGDLRDTNVMVWVEADGTVLNEAKEVKVEIIDFDWSGKNGEMDYPLSRSSNLPWPGNISDKIVFEHDKHWVDSMFSETDGY